jgi:hypothetical protein
MITLIMYVEVMETMSIVFDLPLFEDLIISRYRTNDNFKCTDAEKGVFLYRKKLV